MGLFEGLHEVGTHGHDRVGVERHVGRVVVLLQKYEIKWGGWGGRVGGAVGKMKGMTAEGVSGCRTTVCGTVKGTQGRRERERVMGGRAAKASLARDVRKGEVLSMMRATCLCH